MEGSAAGSLGKAAKAWYGVPNYLPERPEGEDNKTIQAHIEWMQDEKRVRPRKPDYVKIKTLMTRTLADRREMIVVRAASVADVLVKFPWLGDEDEVRSFFFSFMLNTIEGKLKFIFLVYMFAFYLTDFALLQEIYFTEKPLHGTLLFQQMADEYKRLTTKNLPEQVDEFSKKYCRVIMNEIQKISEKKRPPLINLLVEKLQALRTEEERKGNIASLGLEWSSTECRFLSVDLNLS